MALRDQPYLPFYTQDFLTDEKLIECSAASHGVYIRLMCIMHKSTQYGTISLKAKDKQTSSKISDFAIKLTRQMPFPTEEIEEALEELLEEGVLTLDGDTIYQKRMVKDAALSENRARAGAKGGKSNRNTKVTGNYHEKGKLYVAFCSETSAYKIGISVNPAKRIGEIASRIKKDVSLVSTYPVDDMGDAESAVLSALDNWRDGEWVYGLAENQLLDIVSSSISLKQTQSKNEAKRVANTENEIENENKYENDTEIEEEVGNTKKTTPARRKKVFDHQSPAYLLAMYLSKQIKKRLPSTQPAGEEKLQSWADAIDKCNRLDGHPWDEIKLVLKFSQDDSFWQQNILSGAKFREKYVQLLAKMQQGGSKHARINSAFLTHDQELSPLARRAVEMALAESEDGAYEECTE